MQSITRDQDLIYEGDLKRALKVAKSMISDDFSTATISKHTGLSEQELEELKAELSNN